MKRHYENGRALIICILFLTATLPCPAGAAGPDFLSDVEIKWLAAHDGKIRVAPDPHYPPMEYFNEQGIFTGIAADYLRLIEKKLQCRFVIVRLNNFEEILEKAKNREIDVVNTVIKTPERAEYLLFTPPYIAIPNVIVVRAEEKRNLKIGDLKEMTGIVYQSGYAIGSFLREQHKIFHARPVDDAADALKDLAVGNIDVMVGNLAVIAHHVRRLKLSNLRVAGDCEFDDAISFACRKDWPIFNRILGKVLERITPEEHQVISDKWIQIETAKFYHDKRFLMGLFGGLGLFLISIALLYAWNRALKKQVGIQIRELKLRESALVKSREKYRLIADHTADVISILDMNLRFTYISPSVKRLLGFTVAEATAMSIEKAMTPESLVTIRRVYDEEMAKEAAGTADPGRTRIIELEQYKKDGSTVWTEASLSFLRDKQRQPTGIMAVSRDISERRRAAAEREKLEARFRQAQKVESVGRLAGGIAHDFNNMLMVILGHAEMAMELADPGQPIHDDLVEIRTAALRSADLVNQLLAFARKQIISPQVLELNDTVSGMLKMLRRLIGENIHLTWNPGAELWPVKMDPTQIDQILVNLAVNARDAIDGVGHLAIATQNVIVDSAVVGLHEDFIPGEYVLLTVSDDGCGMETDILENLFEPFYTTKEVGRGTGLGLATVYGIVKQNSGFITVDSEPGRGTTFKIYLPRHAAAAKKDQERVSATPLARGNETILLVEDEPSILKMGRTLLERLGYRVLTAAAPEEAIRLAGEYAGKIHLLMTDVVMPGMNGRDLAERLHAIHPHPKCLFMSGYTADIIADHGVLDGGVHFIQKPFSKHDLAVKVREAIDD
jgi:two-component system sensor histidine kinase EvgS